MPIGLIIDLLPNLLNEYTSISQDADLKQYAEKIADPNSTLNIISDLIDYREFTRPEMQYYHNLLKDLTISKAGKEFFSFRFDLYEISQSPSFNHIRVYAFVKHLISINEFEYFSLADCFRMADAEKSLIPHLREHLQWLYREKILTKCIYKLDPKNYIEKYGPQKPHIPDPQARYSELDFSLLLKSTRRESLYGRLCESFEALYGFMKERHQGALTDWKIFEKGTKDYKIEKLEFFLTDVLTNIISRHGALKPTRKQIDDRKNEFILRGDEIPLINFWGDTLYDEFTGPYESEVDDLDKLFPETYQKLDHLYRFRDFLIKRLDLHYETENVEARNLPPPLVKSLHSEQQSKSYKRGIHDLKDAFENASQYIAIMNLLADKMYCQPKTHVWKDKKKGYKCFLVALLKDLHLKGYYRNKKELKHEEIKRVAQNTFGVNMSIDTIKRAEVNSASLSFIPYASGVVPE
jgi:hypothetical protein